MSVSSITPNAAATTTSTTDTFSNPNSALNQTNFLQLLVAQIQYQDPMNPQSDTAMAAQLAQFTSLQQATQSTSSLAMMQANSLVGSTVNIQVNSTDSTSGLVTGVVMNNGAPQIMVGGTNYSLSQVTAITPPSTSGTTGTNGATSNSSQSTP